MTASTRTPHRSAPTHRQSKDPAALAAALREGARTALARAITLAESTRADHRATAEAVLAAVLPCTGQAVRIGITGTPGVGKSTFIEAFGRHLTGAGHRVAVLAVDPSSRRSGGSILGDKTRMTELARDPRAFIRPSPASGTLGGVARRTREAMLLAEASGFDVILVETVGVGQSETAVADMVDLFLLLLAPGGGDELQGIKRGIMELADLIVVNKADGDLLKPARIAATEYRSALHLLRPRSPHWQPQVLLASALERTGIEEVWDTVERHRGILTRSGELATRRADQAKAWLWSELTENLTAAFRTHPAVAAALPGLEADVVAGRVAPSAAARALMTRFAGGSA
ncbi:MAG TPA: methylmalonyl Co-A mutase-associated GTPase MeaB [Candidatus Cybelea sp.]|nr:methylmalonyl Co-A mutase-associated GTPase MeaB [Candidatus Cybelea sp.]